MTPQKLLNMIKNEKISFVSFIVGYFVTGILLSQYVFFETKQSYLIFIGIAFLIVGGAIEFFGENKKPVEN